MIKKIICLAGSLIILCGFFTTAQGSANSTDTLACKAVSYLSGEELFDAKSDGVTRGEFVNAVVKIFNKAEFAPHKSHFTDVAEDYKYFNSVNYAAEAGYISESSQFNPDKAVSLPEAYKIIMKASGHASFAENSGLGYPDAYIRLAAQYNFNENIAYSDNKLSVSDACSLIYNVLSAKMINSVYTDNYAEKYESGDTYLKKLYNLTELRGIVTSSFYSSIIYNGAADEQTIGINGELFNCETDLESFLGMNVKYLLNDETDEVAVVSPYKNKELEVAANDIISVSDDYLRYYQNNKEKKVKIKKSFSAIYNGGLSDGFKTKYIEDNFSPARLVDNDNDGKYDIIFINKYEYKTVNNVDYVNENIGFEENGGFIDLSVSGIHSRIIGSDGQEMEIYDLKKDDKAAVKASEDGKLIEIQLCNEMLSGLVEEIDIPEKKIKVNGEKYNVTDYVCEQYISKGIVSPGSSLTAILGLDGQIAFVVSDERNYTVGYFVKATIGENEKGEQSVCVKIFTSSGIMNRFYLDDKVIVNGSRTGSAEAGKLLEQYKNGSLIKYSVSNDGTVKRIVLPKKFDGNTMKYGENKSSDDLICYYDNQSLSYRSSSLAYVSSAKPCFVVTKSTIFSIPKDIFDDESFCITDYSKIQNDDTSKVSAYNIDENGKSEYIVLHDGMPASYNTSSQIMMVESVGEAVNEDEEDCILIYGWLEGSFEKELVPKGTEIKKKSGEALTAGDIVRFEKFNGKVKKVFVDYDCSGGVPAADTTGGADWSLPKGNSYCSYQDGGIYKYGSDTVVLSDTLSPDGVTYDFSFDCLKVFRNTNNMICFNTKTKKIRKISSGEIKDYTSYSNDCQRIIIRQSYGRANAIIIIE